MEQEIVSNSFLVLHDERAAMHGVIAHFNVSELQENFSLLWYLVQGRSRRGYEGSDRCLAVQRDELVLWPRRRVGNDHSHAAFTGLPACPKHSHKKHPGYLNKCEFQQIGRASCRERV